MTKEDIARKIAKKHEQQCEDGGANYHTDTSIINAMQEYADQETKELKERVENEKASHKLTFDVRGREIDRLNNEVKQLQAKIDELEKANEMVNYILQIDWLTTIEFCDKYNVPKPVFTGEVNSSVNEMLRIDAVKHRMFVQKAKELSKPTNKSIND